MIGLAEKKLTVWQKRIGKLNSAEVEHGLFLHILPVFSAMFVCFQPLSFCFSHICLFSSHYSEIFAQSQDWQNSVTLKHGTSALQNRMGALGPHCTESWTTLMATGWVSKTWQLDHWICTLEKDKDKVQKCHFLSWTLGMPLSCPFYSIWPNLMTCLKPLALVWVLDKEQVCWSGGQKNISKHFLVNIGVQMSKLE